MAREKTPDLMSEALYGKQDQGKALADHIMKAEKKPGNLSKSNKLSKQDKPIKSGNQGMIRKTFIIKPEYHEKIKALAYWERKEIMEIMEEILDSYFQGKTVKPIPSKNKAASQDMQKEGLK